jgi:predicted O-linked N-acetylglucosamine transferase (SPINDLY family)
MDSLTQTLAYSRMAPIQCVTWGHPDTTGSPAMDYFVSSQLAEPDEADGHYSERLVRLPNLGVYYIRPALSGPARTREFFGLDPARHVYLCPQTLFKFHPDFDPVLRGILEADPQGDLVVMAGRVPNWTHRLRQRWARTLGESAARVRFVAAQPNADFLQLLAQADVVLDPFPFGGGNTTYEALAVGVPVVTWPGRFLRGRLALAMYRQLGWQDCVVNSAPAYIALAVRLAIDASFRDACCAQIRAMSPVLFEDGRGVTAWEDFLRAAVDQPQPLREQSIDPIRV